MSRGQKIFLAGMGIATICLLFLAVGLVTEIIEPLPVSLLSEKPPNTPTQTGVSLPSSTPVSISKLVSAATPTITSTQTRIPSPTETPTGTATFTPFPTETPTPIYTPTIPPQTITEFFPFHLGSSWTYNYSHRTADEQDPEKVNTILGSFTDHVEFVRHGGGSNFRMIDLKRSGTPPFTDPSTFCFEDTFWYLADEHRLFLACSWEDIQRITQELYAEIETGIMSDRLLRFHVYSVPLEVGDKWGGFGGLGGEYCDYWWCVESQEEIIVPAGNFKNCYRLALRTNPDATVRWICPGVGLVAAEYFHFGALNEVRLELASFSIPNVGDQPEE